MLVFNLVHLLTPALCAAALSQLRTQLDSFRVHASTSPLFLVGTRKDEALVLGGGSEAEVFAEIDEILRAGLTEVRLANVVVSGHVAGGDVCFFPVENSRNYSGDATIRHLVGAIEKAAVGLPALQQRVPAGWLAVYDELQAHLHSPPPPRQWLKLSEVIAIARRRGLPHMPHAMPLEREVELMLAYLHTIGAVCWFDVRAPPRAPTPHTRVAPPRL